MQTFEIDNLVQLHNVVMLLSNAYGKAGVDALQVRVSPITLYVRNTSLLTVVDGDDDIRVALRSGNV